MKFDVVVVHENSRGIGINGQLPIKCPEDLSRFKKITMTPKFDMKHTSVIMGRKTYESIGRLLPGRTNIIVTSKSIKQLTTVANSIEQAILYSYHEGAYPYIIGGGEIYEYAVNKLRGNINAMHITLIDADIKCDTFFPKYRDSFSLIDETGYIFATNGTRINFTRWV